MLNAPWQDSWFVPGDRSYMVRLLEDAGGNYARTMILELSTGRVTVRTVGHPECYL